MLEQANAHEPNMVDDFEKHYKTNWNNPAMHKERTAWIAAYKSMVQQFKMSFLLHGTPAAAAGPSEAVKFTDQSTAGPVEKARRYLTAMGDPRRESAQDAFATLAALEQLAAAPTTQPAPQQEPTVIDPATMELAESVGLIGPASRTHDLHAAIQRFHDLICTNATNKAAAMAAEAISGASPQQDALSQAARDVLNEVERATRKFPTWPTDPLHAIAVLGEEFGELTKDMLQLTYEPHKTSAANVRTEALQTAAMALRLFMSLDRYEYRPGVQHSQDTDRAAQKGK